MAKGPPRISPLVVQEAFAAGSASFLLLLRQVEPKQLPPIIERWVKDFRPWAREQALAFADAPPIARDDRLIVKRLFKHFERAGDHEVVGAFMVAFDRMVRREVRTRGRYDWKTRRSWTEQTLVSPSNTIYSSGGVSFNPQTGAAVVVPAAHAGSGASVFAHATRHYLRRRAWRYFRRLGFQKPAEYVAAIAPALARYTDADLPDGLAVLESWGLLHACFGESDVVAFGVSHARLTRAASLDEMVAPYFPVLWKRPDAAEALLDLLWGAKARVVMMWAAHLLRRDHAGALRDVPVDNLLRLLDHADPQVQQLGAELFENAAGLDKLDVATWLRLLGTKNVTAVALIAEAMRKHVRPERLMLDEAIDVARAAPVPVARLGLEFLRARRFESAAEREALARLATARSEGVGRDLAAFALSIVGAAERYDVDLVSRFFDSLRASIRAGAWTWLTAESAGWGDPALWARLIESPYDDVRLPLIEHLRRRSALPGVGVERLATLWTGVLLGVHRGGRAKLTALRQVADALRAEPRQAEALLPVLAVALRSVRLPEARAGLAAVVSVVEARPEIEPLVAKYVPELVLQPAGGA